MTERQFSSTSIVVLAPGEAFPSPDPARPALYVKYRGVELAWSPQRAMLQCDPELVEALLPAVAEFNEVEQALRDLEAEVAAAWPEVEQDTAVAFDVGKAELKRCEEVGERMRRAFRRRIRFARLEKVLHKPGAALSAPGRKLGEELREKADVEQCAEVLDGQLEVYEHVYEIAAQRMGEFRAARQAHILEVAIIWILSLEAALMLGDVLVRFLR